MSDNHAYGEPDLVDLLEAQIAAANAKGYDSLAFSVRHEKLTAIIDELRAARNVVGGAQTMRTLYPHIWEEYSRNGLMQALADYEDNGGKNRE